MNFDKILGIIFMAFGLFIAIYALYELIFRIIMAILGLFIVNFGMRLRGMPPIHLSIIRLWTRRYDF